MPRPFFLWFLERYVLYNLESSLVFNSPFLLWLLSVLCYWDYFPFRKTRLSNSNHIALSILTIYRAKWFMASFLFLRFCSWKKKNKWFQRWWEMSLFMNKPKAGPEGITLRGIGNIRFLSVSKPCTSQKIKIMQKPRSIVLTPMPFLFSSIFVKLFCASTKLIWSRFYFIRPKKSLSISASNMYYRIK